MDATAAATLNVTERISGQTQLFGLSAQQTSALAASMLALKVRPEVAATSIEGMLRILGTADMQSKRFQDSLGRLGMTASGLKESIGKDAQGALFDLLEAIGKAEDPASLLAGMFGAEYSGDLAKLALNLGTYRKAVSSVADVQQYAGSMQGEFAERTKTASNAVQLLKNRSDALSITFGDSLLPVIKEMSPAVGKAIDEITNFAAESPKLTAGVAIATAGLGYLGQTAGPVLSAAGGLLTASAWMQLRAAKLQLAAAGTGGVGGGLLGPGGKGRGIRGKASETARSLGSKIGKAGSRVGSALKGRAGILGAGIAALNIGSTLLSDQSRAEKTRGVSEDLGALGGALAGAKLGRSRARPSFPARGPRWAGSSGASWAASAATFSVAPAAKLWRARWLRPRPWRARERRRRHWRALEPRRSTTTPAATSTSANSRSTSSRARTSRPRRSD